MLEQYINTNAYVSCEISQGFQSALKHALKFNQILFYYGFRFWSAVLKIKQDFVISFSEDRIGLQMSNLISVLKQRTWEELDKCFINPPSDILVEFLIQLEYRLKIS